MSSVTLAVDGMTCASCAARIEKRLNRIDGVHASVNFATEQASIDFPDGVTADQLVAAVEATGYTAMVDRPEHTHDHGYLRRSGRCAPSD
jgi:Cu+-exporting ATPase